MRGWLDHLRMRGSRMLLPTRKAAGSASFEMPVSWFRPHHGRRAAAACLAALPVLRTPALTVSAWRSSRLELLVAAACVLNCAKFKRPLH